jgi:hypothetical protein
MGPSPEGVGVMLGVDVVLFLLLGQVPGESAEPSGLVMRLGARRYAEREAASRALEGIGGPALDALRAARGSRDAEIRNRAAGLVQKIEGALLTQPTRLRLDLERAPLTDVVRSLSRQAGFKIVLYPDSLPKWRYTKVTLREPEPVPFWKAIDRLCDAAAVQPYPQLHGIAGPREPTFALTDGTSRAPTPNYDHGPFRVSLLGVHYQRDVTFSAPPAAGAAGFVPPNREPRSARQLRPSGGSRPAPAPARLNPVISEQFTAHLLVAAEPRLCISQTGALQLLEAVDDRGHSLIAQDGGGPVANRFAGYFGVMSGPVIQLQVQFQRPENPGRTIKKLRGVIPVSVCSRSPEPLVVPLDQGAGKRFANDDVEVTLQGIRKTTNPPQTFLELSVKSNDRPGAADNGDADAFGDVYRADTHRQQLEILDARGRPVTWFPSGVDSETSRLTLTLMNLPANAALKELRYYTLTRATLDLPFEFTDIPMP